MLDKKQIPVIFFLFFFFFSYLSSKWVIKQQRHLTTSTMDLAQELLINVQCSSVLTSFAKETRALKMRSTVASYWKLTTSNWEDHRSWSSDNYMRSCWRTQWYCMVVQHLKQTGKAKKLDKWMAHEFTKKKKKKKKVLFWSVIFSYSLKQQQTISWSNCDMQ